jgi:hypothetical protein
MQPTLKELCLAVRDAYRNIYQDGHLPLVEAVAAVWQAEERKQPGNRRWRSAFHYVMRIVNEASVPPF